MHDDMGRSFNPLQLGGWRLHVMPQLAVGREIADQRGSHALVSEVFQHPSAAWPCN